MRLSFKGNFPMFAYTKVCSVTGYTSINGALPGEPTIEAIFLFMCKTEVAVVATVRDVQ